MSIPTIYHIVNRTIPEFKDADKTSSMKCGYNLVYNYFVHHNVIEQFVNLVCFLNIYYCLLKCNNCM